MTSLELRKLLVKFRNKDKLSIRDISKTVVKSKSVIHNILRKLEEYGSCKVKKPPGCPKKSTSRKTYRFVMNQKRIDLWLQPLSLKELMLILALKYQVTLFPWRLNEINLNSQEASKSFTFLKITKRADWNLPLDTAYGLNNSEIMFISAMSQSLTNLVMTGEDSFEAVLRNNICLSALNSCEKVWWCLVWFCCGTGPLVRLHGEIYAAGYKEIIKKHVPNLRTAINQPAVFTQDNFPCHTAKSVKTFLSEEDVTVIEWPALSPVVNAIDNVWKLLNERAKEKNPRNVKLN